MDADALDKLRREMEFEKRRHEEQERELAGKVAEYERRCRDAQGEILRVKGEFERIGDLLQGSFGKFNPSHEYSRSTHKYNLEGL